MKKLLFSPRTYGIAALSLVVFLAGSLVGAMTAFIFRFREQDDAPKREPYSFLLYSQIRWDGAFQRPQHLAIHLTGHGEVFYLDPVPIHWVVQRPWYYVGFLLKNIQPRLWVLRPWTLPGENQSALILRWNRWSLVQYTRMILMVRGINAPVFYSNVLGAAAMMGAFREALFVYDIIDDFTVTSWITPDAPRQEARLLREADLITTGTRELLLRKCAGQENACYIPCGVEYEKFSLQQKAGEHSGLTPHPRLDHLPRPIIGYFGVVNERLDANVLLALADAHPEWSIVLIGPVHSDFPLAAFANRWTTVIDDTSREDFRLRETRANLHFVGLMPYAELPSALALFDVAILPYKRSPVTEIIHPVKILEYLSSGKPVASTALPDIAYFYGDLVHLAEEPDAFVGAVEAALADTSPASEQRRRDYAAEKSWDGMGREFFSQMERSLREKVKGVKS